MVAQYTIAGRQIGSHILAIATLSTLFAGSAIAMGGSKKTKEQGPALNATSADEEKFIREFMQQAEKEGAGAKH
ncbi:MAG: hypothetical protein M1817_006171 [Caeruleum heppii]|nr:MAG: hypothetical protein M1817_006171 [Caeruleum heppii]